MTDKQVGAKLNRDPKAVSQCRSRLGLMHRKNKSGKSEKPATGTAVSATPIISDEDKKELVIRQLVSSPKYSALKDVLTEQELKMYIDKYVGFMMDPTIESMTFMEEDALNQCIIAEIRMYRLLKEEKDDRQRAIDEDGRPHIDKSKAIRECEEIILKFHRSLNVEREQRLKTQADQSKTFVNLVREMKNPANREKMGREAAMLKYIAEKWYNDNLMTDDNKEGPIRSGNDIKFNIGSIFKDGSEPEGLASDFLPRGVIDNE
jgi:hypothetical protein